MTTHPRQMVLTVKEVGQLLRVQRSKVYEMVRAGLLEGFKIGNDWRIKRDSVERLIGPIPNEFFSDPKSTIDKLPANGYDPLKIAS